MLSLIARKASAAAAAELLATNAKCVVARGISTDGPQRSNKGNARKNAGSNKGRNLLFGDDKKQPRNNAVATAEGSKDSKPQYRKKKTFSFSNSKNAPKEPEAELEVFDYPAYWNEDFPEGFDDAMKHEVEKLQIFADFTPYLDLSWQTQIHELFNGEAIQMTLNCPLEDFDERLFVDDKNTYDTKVVMEVPLSCFSGLSKEGLEIVKQLAGPRYNANKNNLKLTEDRYPTRVFNHKRLCDILRDLTQTAHELSTKAKVSA
uniref:Small ribosomal subunit protein mS35 mitochondrial conserved domain-containing protein n=1 Tax=Globisporangium ultimum (strain ATCC 200006 / CBS 805.95 / DAOM BR144) TaxID=431595 RepID=K3WC94_GLOUD